MTALEYFLAELNAGHLTYDPETGAIWRKWELRRGWLLEPKRAEKLTGNGYYVLRSTPKGYGPQYCMAHRAVFSFATETVLPDSLEINHKNGIKTDNRLANLEAVTRIENERHARDNGLLNPKTGADNWRCKLTDDDVREVRRLATEGGMKQREIAERFGVRPNQVSRILSGKRRAA